MKRFLYLFIFSFAIITNAQTIQKQKNQPDIRIDVNVQRDDNGNIIGYDSTYVETWSSDGTNVNTDSLMRMLRSNFIFEFNDDDNGFFETPDIDAIQRQMMEDIKQMEQMFQFNCMPKSQNNNSKPNIKKSSYPSIKI